MIINCPRCKDSRMKLAPKKTVRTHKKRERYFLPQYKNKLRHLYACNKCGSCCYTERKSKR